MTLEAEGGNMDDRAHQRLHIIEGLLAALDRLAEVNRLVASAPGRDEARSKLMADLGFSEVQADHVLDMTVARQTAGARADLVAEAARLRS